MVKWHTEAITESGDIDFDGVKQSLKYICPHCSHEFEPTKEQLQQFNE